MTADTGRRMVLVSMVVTSITIAYAYFKKKPSSQGFRVAWAVGAMWLILALGADAAPEVAGPLALLIMLGVIFAKDQTLAGILHLTPGGNQDETQLPSQPPAGEEA